jgi:hypothetical protein
VSHDKTKGLLFRDPASPPVQAPAGPSKQPKQHSKWAQEEVIRRVREKYPGGNVGNASTAAVCRKISDKGYDAKWDTVNRALGRELPKE